MTYNRRPLSLVISLALGIGAALLILLAGGHPAAAAPATIGDSKPAPAGPCHARDDSAVTVYSSSDSSAVRQAVAAAVPSDTVRLAGTCAGVAAQGGTTQTVVITKALTLVGGYALTEWVSSFPLTQPTTLDAQGLGRVITASADITVAALTVQYGQSFGGNGGGIYAGGKFTSLGAVNFLSNTTLVSTTVNGALAPNFPAGYGGALFTNDDADIRPSERLSGTDWVNNSAYNGGAAYFNGQSDLANAEFTGNTAAQSGGAVYANGILHLINVVFDHNSSSFAGGSIFTNSGATIQYIQSKYSSAPRGGFWAGISQNNVYGDHISAYADTAQYGAFANFYQPFAFITDSGLVSETASSAGGAFYMIDSFGSFANDSFIGVSAPLGSVLYIEKFLSPIQISTKMDAATLWRFSSPFPPHTATTGSVNPLASSTAPTGSAFFTSGFTLFITDTIISGYGTDLETGAAPSSTIVGDYNLFDHTPVISGTNISTGTHSLVGNPLFADALGHLSAGSPAIDHGIDVGINVDLDGNPRPSGAGFDIGAYEFQVAKLFLPLVRR